jgi:amidase
MNLDEYASKDALDLAHLVKSRQITAVELRDLGIQAIDQVNPRLNAVVGTTLEEADAALGRIGPTAPFSGVPFLIKDLGLMYAGVPSEGGSRILKGLVPPHDSELAIRHKRAGLVTIGRTNTPEFGNNASTEPVANGPTRNPWDLRRSSGGSSGGAAAAVAAGITPIAHASDGGGSIRVPAANCGVFGLKPSRGRNPSGPDLEELLFGLVNDHAVSRSVRDSAALLDATAGPEIGSRLLIAPPTETFLTASQHDPRRLRIAFTAQPGRGGDAPHPDCIKMVEDVAALCQTLGHEVYEAAPSIDVEEVTHVFLVLAAVAVRQAVMHVHELTGRLIDQDTLEATNLKIVQFAASCSAADLDNALGVLHRITRTLGEFFTSCDLWLSPTLAAPPPLLGYLNSNDPALSARDWISRIMATCPYTAMFNQSGQPAMSVPLYWNEAGLPIGSHFAAHLGAEETLFSLAGQLERARPWAQRRPPVHVAARDPSPDRKR